MTEFTGSVAVLGASGETGRHIVKALRAKNILVRALVRNAANTHLVEMPGVEVVIGDALSEVDLRQVCEGTTAIMSALGGRNTIDPTAMDAIEHQSVRKVIAVAKALGINRIVMCSSMGTEAPERIPFLMAVLKVKRLGEEALEQSGLIYTIIRPGGLVNQSNPGDGVLVSKHFAPTGRMMTARADVAAVMVQALFQPAAQNGNFEVITQPQAGAADRPDLFLL